MYGLVSGKVWDILLLSILQLFQALIRRFMRRPWWTEPAKIKQTIHVTMPGIAPFIALMTIMSIGSVLNAGFDQIFNLYSPAVYATGDIIDTLVYRLGLINQQYSLSAAVGLLKSVVSCILVLTGYKLADKYAGYKVW